MLQAVKNVRPGWQAKMNMRLEKRGERTVMAGLTHHGPLRVQRRRLGSAAAVDHTAASVASLMDGASTSIDLVCHPVETLPGCTWAGVDDPQSGVRTLSWALGSSPYASE